ncbi:Uncharacterised protein [uncultured archaeon]|nr:Uncharacterised protein [uncultured archaeon]
MHKLDKSVQITLIIVATVIALAVIGIIVFKSNSVSNTFNVNGQATSKVAPDLITVYFSIDTSGATSKEAEDANSAITDKLTDNIVALGFSKEELKTQSFNIYPEYDYSKSQRLIDYRASTSLKIELSIQQKDKISDIIDAGTNAGAGISYINFELTPSLQQNAKADAIKTASADAKVKAEALAQGFNKRLGRLVSVSLDQFNYNPWPVYTASADAGVGVAESNAKAKSTMSSMTPSNQEVSAYVTAIYKLI